MTVSNARIFTDVLDDIVTNVRNEYDTINDPVVFPTYLFGHYQAIASELIEKSLVVDTRDKKYPLIILGIDPDYREREINDSQYEVSCNIWIVEETKEEWYTSDRFDNIFKLILFPIYELLKSHLLDSKYVNVIGIHEFTPEVELFPYWGTQSHMGAESEVLNDPLDAIKIKIRNLIINTDQC